MIDLRLVLMALAASIAGNLALGSAWLTARDRAATAVVQRDDAREAASICSDATEDLRDLASQRKREAAAAQAAARAAARSRQQLADEILATPPSVPGDDCRSAQERAQRWLQGRGKRP